ncbi:hypothetical protein [Vibrio hippocampi]|uniref:Uncharacterized protein n=1 Tax=Vibrio hippocampi TaxID=654686 RepID=A0ABN8DPY7_9VIBR|nr:hypothetical protein [Vibrio hippocampi]CAH0530369.1 hypothetical protein VHP8226_04012 [Vibrio hippocampi]
MKIIDNHIKQSLYAFFLLCSLFSFALSVSAQQNTFDSKLNWKVGDSQSYTVTKIGKISLRGDPYEVTTNSDITISVLERVGDGYLLGWKFGETTFDDPTITENPIVLTITNILNGFEMKLVVNRYGELLDVKNWAEMRDRVFTIVDNLMSILSKEDVLSKEQLEAVKQQILSMYETKEQAINITTRSVRLYFVASGVKYNLDEPIVYDGVSPNIFGGDPIPAKMTLTLESIDKEADIAKVSWFQEVDQDALQQAVYEALTKMAKNMDTTLPNADELPRYEKSLSLAAELEIAVSSGWVNRIKYIKITKSEGKEDIETDIWQKK